MSWISGFVTTSPNRLRLVLADSRTCLCVSVRTSVRRGRMVGSEADSCRGARNAMAPMSSIAPFLARHCLSSRPSRSVGRMSLTACPLSLLMMALAASCVASRTSGDESPNAARSVGRISWM